MQGSELQRVKQALLRELDTTLRNCYHQGLQEMMTDLRIRYAHIKPDYTPDDVFSLFMQSGVLKMVSAAPVVHIRESLERLYRGNFGICTLCGREIAAEYLELHPTTSWCAVCTTDSQRLLRPIR